MARPVQWHGDVLAGGSLALGLLAFIGIYVPVFGFLLAIGGSTLGIGALRENRDRDLAVWSLSIDVFATALCVSGFLWSLLIAGLYGIVTSPAAP